MPSVVVIRRMMNVSGFHIAGFVSLVCVSVVFTALAWTNGSGMADSSDITPEQAYSNVMTVMPAKIASESTSISLLQKQGQKPSVVQLKAQIEAGAGETQELSKNIGFSEVENALLLAKLDPFGGLILNAETEASLNRVVARLPENLDIDDIAHIQELIKQSLPGEAGMQVADVLGKYYRYKGLEKAFAMEAEPPNTMQAALEQLSAIAELRYDAMGADYAESLFGVQQRQAEYYLERDIIEQDNAISEELREQQLLQLSAAAEQGGLSFSSLPDDVQQLNDEVAKMRADGEDESLVQAHRERLLGKDAAEQVARMETQQNDWNLRYQEFELEKEIILTAGLSVGDQQQQIDSLFSRHYSLEELPGAKAYDNQQSHY